MSVIRRFEDTALKLSQIAAVSVFAASLLAVSFAGAQPMQRVHRIAMLGNDDTPPWNGLRQGLRELGYVEGRNVAFDWRWSEGNVERLPALARQLVALKPDVIVVSGSLAARAARDATQTIPIVMALVQNPEELGLVERLARPGGNLTGLSTHAPQLTAKKLELLREIAPTVSRVAFLWNPDSAAEQFQYRELVVAAEAAGVTIASIAVTRPADVTTALAAVESSGADALLAVGNPVTFRSRKQIAEFALRRRLPSVFEERLFVEAGGLVSYAPNFTELFRRAAGYVDRILKGAKPAELPIEQPTRFELVINGRTAQALGLRVPPSLLLRADGLIE